MEVLNKVINWVAHPVQNVRSVIGMIGSRDANLEKGQHFPAVIVNKNNQTLRYYDKNGNEVFKSRVSTGYNRGDKQKAGDMRTSSGTFVLGGESRVDPNHFGSSTAHWTNMRNPNGALAQVGVHGDAGHPEKIGTRASHGCIRMPNDNYEELNKLLNQNKNTQIIIRGNKQGGIINYLDYIG